MERREMEGVARKGPVLCCAGQGFSASSQRPIVKLSFISLMPTLWTLTGLQGSQGSFKDI